MAKILLVEDDDFLREGLTELLKKEGYEAVSAETLTSARALVKKAAFDLLLLDVLLPDGNGLELCREIRQRDTGIPILFITACDEEKDIVAGLDAGADDYVTKPFQLKVLLSRVRALLRRAGVNAAGTAAGVVPPDVFLTPTERQILTVLVKNRGLIVTRRQLLEQVWDAEGNFIDDNTLSVHISRLREKIGGARIATVRGVGYRWEDAI